jgi:hypothetical protein
MATTLICPLLDKKCLQHRCMFYRHETWVETTTGEQRDGFECLFILQYQVARTSVVELTRNQASVDKVANEIRQGREASGRLLLTLAHARSALREAPGLGGG